MHTLCQALRTVRQQSAPAFCRACRHLLSLHTLVRSHLAHMQCWRALQNGLSLTGAHVKASGFVCASPCGGLCASGGACAVCAGKVFYWELVEAAVVKSFQAHKGAVCSIAMHPEGSLLLTAGVDGSVRVWK
jgi:WD domain, G-beta repeat